MDKNYLIIGEKNELVLRSLQLLANKKPFFLDLSDSSVAWRAILDACQTPFDECWIFKHGLPEPFELIELGKYVTGDTYYVGATRPTVEGMEWVRQPCLLFDEDSHAVISSGLLEELYRLKMDMEKKVPGYWSHHDLVVSEDFRDLAFEIDTLQAFLENCFTPQQKHSYIGISLEVLLEKALGVKVVFKYGEPADGLAELTNRILSHFSNGAAPQQAFTGSIDASWPLIATYLEKNYQQLFGNGLDPLSELQKNTITGHHGNLIHYFSGGQGSETLLIINALGLTIRFWDASMRHLMRRFRLIVWETRCCDLMNGGMEKVVTIDEHVADIAAIIENEQRQPLHLLGWCNGGRIAIAAAAAFPAMVASLILLCPVFRGIREIDPDDTPFERDQQEVFNSVTKNPKIADLLASWLLKTNAKPPDAGGTVKQLLGLPDANMRRDIIAPMSTGDYLLNYARRTFNDEHYPVGQLMTLVRQPVLMILGREDAVISNQLALAAAALLQNCKTVLLRAASHYIQLQQPDILARLIYNFIVTPNEIYTSPRWD